MVHWLNNNTLHTYSDSSCFRWLWVNLNSSDVPCLFCLHYGFVELWKPLKSRLWSFSQLESERRRENERQTQDDGIWHTDTSLAMVQHAHHPRTQPCIFIFIHPSVRPFLLFLSVSLSVCLSFSPSLSFFLSSLSSVWVKVKPYLLVTIYHLS